MKYIIAQNAKPEKTWYTRYCFLFMCYFFHLFSNTLFSRYATVNKFTDLTNSEFKKVYHGHRPQNPDNFPKAKLEKIVNLPDTIDWRTNSTVMTPVKDQGQCGIKNFHRFLIWLKVPLKKLPHKCNWYLRATIAGSCWAFSVVEVVKQPSY